MDKMTAPEFTARHQGESAWPAIQGERKLCLQLAQDFDGRDLLRSRFG